MSAVEKLWQEPKRRVDDEISSTIARLCREGFSLLPLGRGEDGKKPAVDSFDGIKFDLGGILGRMRGGSMYAVRLAGLVVVDVDSDTPEARQYVRQRFGDSAVQVKTTRGVHHYFKIGEGPLPSGVHLDGIDIDIKSGENSFVVGPHSIRPDTGLVYDPITGELGSTDLTVLIDRQPYPTGIQKGQRNDHLFRRALQFAHWHDSLNDLSGEVIAERNLHFEDPADFSDLECSRIAKSVWKYKTEGRLWAGRNSQFGFNRMYLDKLENVTGGQDAAMLLIFLLSNHGHLDREFKIVVDAIHKSGHLRCMSRNTLYKAARLLVSMGILEKRDYKGRIASDYWFVP